MSWLTQYFLNPSFVLPGAALAVVPVIIHLLSRLRYKRVRFAAMEFLLQSDELNRRRLIIEQLLLLLLRVLAVVLIMLLIARFVLDPSGILMLRGATTHHVIIIDDSLSMRTAFNGTTVFRNAIDTVKRMVSQSSSQPRSQRVTVLTMTHPDRPLVTDRTLDGALIQELKPRLDNLKCSYMAVTPVAAIAAAEQILSGDGGVAPRVHVITDLRKSDWGGHPEIAAALKSLDALDAEVSVVKVTDESPQNLVLDTMESETLAVAVGVPWRLNLAFRNYGTQKSTGLRADVYVNGNPLPVKVLMPDVEPNAEVELSHDIVFESPGLQQVEVRLEEDVLLEDNSRFIAVEVTDSRRVLIVDDEAEQQDARYVSLAISDSDLTGITTDQRTSDVLTADDLGKYDSIYLLNVRELPADAVQYLAEYVKAGGGIVWFPDGQANTGWYNSALQTESQKMFPVRLTTVHSATADEAENAVGFDVPVFENHFIFLAYNDPDSALADVLQFQKWFLVADGQDMSALQNNGVKVIARMKDGSPVAFEHSLGRGRILTFLTSAGRRWSNWPVADSPGYVVMHLLMTQYLQKPSNAVQVREVGDGLRLVWPVSQFSDVLEVFLPQAEESESVDDAFLRLQAAPVVRNSADDIDMEATVGEEQLAVAVPQANRPGVCRIKRFRLDGERDEQWLAYNVSGAESDLAMAAVADVEQLLESGNLRVLSAETTGELSGSDTGRDVRWFLLGMLVLVLLVEQLLSLRLSFHPEVKT